MTGASADAVVNHPDLHVLSLGYATELLRTDGGAASDAVNRRRYYASQVGSYTILALTRESDGLSERAFDNLRAVPTNGRNIAHALWRMYRLGSALCRQGRVNVIQAQEPCTTGLVGYLLKLRFGLPMSVCVFGPNPFDENWRRASRFNAVASRWARHILRRVDAIVVDGSLTFERLERAGIDPARMTWKPMVPSNIAEFANADGAALRGRLLDGRFERLLLSIGTMSIQKNVPFVIEAFARVAQRVPKTRLVLVGQGRRRGGYQQLARRLGVDDRILWLDAVPHREIRDYFHACDAVVMGSRFEGFPRVLMEAAASGTAIVTTEVSGCTDAVVPGGNGYVVAQGDLDAFVDRIVELLEDPERAAEMGRAGVDVMRDLAARREWFDRQQVEVWARIRAAAA